MQTKQDKQIKDSVPGNPSGINVHDGLNRAIRIWKKNLKDSNTVTELYDRKEYKKPSRKNREIMEAAKFKQRFQ